MLKCTLLDGRALYLNTDRVLQITQPKDSDSLVVHFTNKDNELASSPISSFELLGTAGSFN